jgi:hypothetical protein
MAEGHNFFRCSHVVLFAFSWSLDTLLQFVNRVHRWNSPKGVTVHVVLSDGTVDRRLESLLHEKDTAAELVLDGKLMGEVVEEMNLRDLLEVAAREFDAASKMVDEEKLLNEWPALRESLRVAAAEWQLGVPVEEPRKAETGPDPE